MKQLLLGLKLRLFFLPVVLFLFSLLPANAQNGSQNAFGNEIIKPAAENLTMYLDSLRGKKVAVVANHTSLVEDVHLVDTLLKRGIEIVRIFGPEHGFRGDAADGAPVEDGVDVKTGIPVISLYGDHKKPTSADLIG
ncbi:MAG TPA: DUF1343 domain-containing protein, partial [Bacteroidales bacterium]|nr:DUF1343 domain-containing protein [Bacteroidales bacterium]